MTDVREQAQVPQKAAAKKIDVEVQAKPATNGGVEFDLQWRPSSGGSWSSGPIDLPKSSGEHDLEFTLNDTSGKNLEFYSAANDAMWVEVDRCPQGQNGDDKRQIRDKDVKSNKKKLTLRDVNDVACSLYYALRFDGDRWTDPAGKSYPPYEYDPEIKNGGG